METLGEMYIVELLSGKRNNAGNFLAKDKNDNIYFARGQFYETYYETFLDVQSGVKSKFAVIIDEIGVDNWEGLTFRTIQFISTNKAKCIIYRGFKFQVEELSSYRMDLIEKQLQLLRSKSSPLLVNEIKKEIEILDTELSQIREALNVLTAVTF